MIPAMIAMQTAGRDGDLAEAKRIWIESPLLVPANRDPAVAQRLREMVDDWSGWQLTGQPNHVDPDPPPAQRLGQLSVPALVIIGGLDNEGIQGVAVEIEAKAPNTRRVVVPRRRPHDEHGGAGRPSTTSSPPSSPSRSRLRPRHNRTPHAPLKRRVQRGCGRAGGWVG